MTMTTEPKVTQPASSSTAPVDDPVGWEPARGVYCAVIFAEAPGAVRQRVAYTRWASLDEARGYIERRMPTVRQVRADEVVSAFVVPGDTHTHMRDGELVQDVILNWRAAQTAYLTTSGYVTW